MNLNAEQCLVIAVLTATLILAIHPDSLLRRGLYPVQLFFLAYSFLAQLPPATSQADTYKLGLHIGTWGSRIIDRVYLWQPETTFLRKDIDDEPGQGPDTYGIVGKALWALELMTAAKGVGWNWQVGGVAERKSSRQAFVVERLTKWLLTFLLIHMVASISSVILKAHTLSRMSGGSTLWAPILHNAWFLRFFMTAGWLTVVYGHITLPENMLAIVVVGTGIGGRWSDPAQWTPAFGNISDSYSLRRCWGKFWHAALRRSTNAPGLWLLHKSPKLRSHKSRTVRLLRRYGLLFLAFSVSGLIHATGSFLVTRDDPKGPSDGGAFLYFLAQPTAIALEDALFGLLGLADDGDVGPMRRLVGYVYVAAFWVYTFPHLKVMPLATAHGLDDGCGPFMAGIKACKELAEAMPFNPATSVIERLATWFGVQ